ncbi:hypothetical protein GCK72_020590 [Caenorhabditis remanei]|uniref:Peptidase M13 C-terminal domain-containing protein n=1 Tax=Caenorhabditis remanei TaxID=31234 RepID=A0A6A5GHN4_CAERE|nr:hypothetical protein GCK72_020590 [Caenorhabditis remanei]KAF1754032.1 hypothetical protein GCK72_020590 [Caenorhabditis remanei]
MSVTDKLTVLHNLLKILTFLSIWMFALYAAVTMTGSSEIQNPSVDTLEIPKTTTPPELPKPEFLVAEPRKVCKSPECIHLAHQLHNWRDISVDPCEDFYKAACGKYNEDTLVQGPRLVKKTRIVQQLVNAFLKEKKSINSTSKSEQALKTFSDLCKQWVVLKHADRVKQQTTTRNELLKKIGSVPAFDKNWKESNFDLNEMLYKTALLGKQNLVFFSMKIENSKRAVIEKDYTIPELLLGYQKEDALKNSGLKPEDQVIEEDFKNVEKLNNELMKFNDLADLEEVPLSQLQTSVPSLNFKKILKGLFNQNLKNEVWDNIKNKIAVPKSSYFFNKTYNLETILKSTPKRVLANYIGMHYRVWVEEVTAINPKEKFICAEKIIEKLPLAALRVFTRYHFDKENIQLATEMVEDIEQSFIETIQGSTWLQQSTKTTAIQKIKLMKKIIGYTKELEVPGALDSFLESLDLSNVTSYLAVNIEIDRFQNEQNYNHMASLLPFAPDKMLVGANAFYDQLSNVLTLNVPFMDDPFFDSTFPNYAKIASIGEVIGHEIGHGFDPNGRKRDENGERKDWWTPEDSAEYDKRAECLINQYNEYDDPTYGRKARKNYINE